MALTPEEKRVLSRNIITYSEYLETIEGTVYDKEERDEIDAKTPDGFALGQKRALNMIKKCIPQVHLIPRTRRDYLDLKQDFGIEEGTNIYHTEPMNYQELFRDGLAGQIGYMHDNDAGYDNGYINASSGFSAGSYSHGGQGALYGAVFNKLCPQSYECFLSMGWTYASLDHPLHIETFYKGERN